MAKEIRAGTAYIVTTTFKILNTPEEVLTKIREDYQVHNNSNESCPLNDPETFANPATAGLPCTCTYNPKIVFTNGCFDLLHYGHIYCLEQAARYGDYLVVAVNSDQSIREIKGPKRPIISETYRMRSVAALQCVDFVLRMAETTPHSILKILKPDVLVKASEYQTADFVGHEIVEEYGGKLQQVAHIPSISTTAIIDRITAAQFLRKGD